MCTDVSVLQVKMYNLKYEKLPTLFWMISISGHSLKCFAIHEISCSSCSMDSVATHFILRKSFIVFHFFGDFLHKFLLYRETKKGVGVVK